MSRKRFLALPALVLAVGLVAGPADASRQDSWLGHPFMTYHNDMIAYPHRAAQDEWQNTANAIFVPDNANFGGGPDPGSRGTPFGDNFVQGLVTFGKDNWGLIFAGNEQRGYNPTKALGTHELRPAAYQLERSYGDFAAYPQGVLFGSSDVPDPRMQIGFGYGLASLDLGLFYTNATSKNTSEFDPDGAGGTAATKTGDEASYNAFTVSANLPTISAFNTFELGLTFSTGSTERFGTAGSGGVGTGDNSSFAVTWLAELASTWVGFNPNFRFTYGSCSADYTIALASGATGTAQMWELKGSTIRGDIGGVRRWNNARVAANLGFQIDTEENTINEPVAGFPEFAEDTFTVFPVCGTAAEYWVRPWFGIDTGVTFAFADVTSKEEERDTAGAVTSNGEDKDTQLQAEFGAGIVFRIARDTWNADIAMNLRNDVLGNPGQIIGGGIEDNPVFAIEALFGWGGQ